MALVKVKPTSNGRRAVVKLVNPDLHKGTSVPALTEKKNRKSGRNNAGRITMRHQGGGHKQNYRVIDFLRSKDGIPAKVERFEYDPNRSANLALLCYADGERRYILAPEKLKVGDTVIAGDDNVVAGTGPDAVVTAGANNDLAPGSEHDQVRAIGPQDNLVLRAAEDQNTGVRRRAGERVTGAAGRWRRRR